jgi:hypothetical protein
MRSNLLCMYYIVSLPSIVPSHFLQLTSIRSYSGETATLTAQRQELEDERAKFTDAAIRLARERSEFEASPSLVSL